MTGNTYIFKHKQRLESRRAELLSRSESCRGLTKPIPLDQTVVGRLSRMDALQYREIACANERRRSDELQRIDVALSRIASNDYGFCVQCDENIPEKRLAIDPATLVCVDCGGR